MCVIISTYKNKFIKKRKVMGEVNKIIESLGSIDLGGIKSWFSIEYLTGLINGLVNKIPANIMAIYNENKALCLFGAICLLCIIAFEGYKIVRMIVFGGGAFLCGYVGYVYLAPFIPAELGKYIPDIVDIKALCAVACALIAVMLCCFAYNLALFVIAAAGGYLIGSTYVYGLVVGYFHTLTFLQDPKAEYIVGGVVAVIFAMVIMMLFKPLLMLITSFGFMTGAAVLAQKLLVPAADDSLKLSFVVLGLAVGLFAFIRQRKEESFHISIF